MKVLYLHEAKVIALVIHPVLWSPHIDSELNPKSWSAVSSISILWVTLSKQKESAIQYHLQRSTVILIEMWLCQDESDTIKIGDLTSSGYQFLHKVCMGHRGGGIGVLLNKTCSAKMRKCDRFKSFEYLDMDISFGGTEFCLIMVYHPPPLGKIKQLPKCSLIIRSTCLNRSSYTPASCLCWTSTSILMSPLMPMLWSS